MCKIKIIVAVTENMVIGDKNDLPWSLPTDLKYFKETTNGHTVIMGRKCWESIPVKHRPLPNRTNIVISRDKDYKADGAKVHTNFKELIVQLKENGKDDDIFIIGGGELYKEAFKHACTLYLTRIHSVIEGDVKLNGLDFNDWDLDESSELFTENGLDFNFQIFSRK
jgi:dihydrofolate reductase